MTSTTYLPYTVTLTRPDGSVVKTLVVPVLQESADAGGNASSRLGFGAFDFTERRNAEQALRSSLSGLEHAACNDANDRAIAIAREVAGGGRQWSNQPGVPHVQTAELEMERPDLDLRVPCDEPGCEDLGGEWEVVNGRWCYDHVPRLDEVPQEWLMDGE